MKFAAFEEIQKIFPDRDWNEATAENFYLVQEVMDMKVKMDAVLNKVSNKIKTQKYIFSNISQQNCLF